MEVKFLTPETTRRSGSCKSSAIFEQCSWFHHLLFKYPPSWFALKDLLDKSNVRQANKTNKQTSYKICQCKFVILKTAEM